MAKYKTLSDLGGLFTSLPEDKIPDRNASDINSMDLSVAGMIQTSGGYELYANEIVPSGGTVGKIQSMFLFRKNFGTHLKVKIRTRDNGTNTILEWLNPNNTTTADGKWEPLHSTFTTGKVMGYTPFNDSTTNKLVMGNGTDNYTIWNGATGQVASVTSNTIVISETIASEGFASSGDIEVDGTQYAYSGTSGSTFTGVTPDPTSQNPSAGTGVAQSPDTTTYSSLPKGNVLLTAGGRVWLAGVPTRPSTLYYSKVADATNYTAGTNPDDAGIEEFTDGGGGITLLDARENQKILVHKEDGLLIFRLDYPTLTAKIPYLDVVKISDGIGATNPKAGAGLNNISYFMSNVEGIKSVKRAFSTAEIDVQSVTDIIVPTIKKYDNSNAAAVYHPAKRAIYVATKSSSDVSNNDTVIAFYIRKGVNGDYIGDLSIFKNLYINDWLVDGSSLFGGSSVTQNVYKMFETNSANGTSISHSYTTKADTFNSPEKQKEFNTLYVEGLIQRNTKIKVTVLYGMFGLVDRAETIIEWDDNTYVHDTQISALGTDVLGTHSLGAQSPEIMSSYPFAVPIHFNPRVATRYKVKFETYYDDKTTASPYWAIINMGSNPKEKDADFRRTLNSNN